MNRNPSHILVAEWKRPEILRTGPRGPDGGEAAWLKALEPHQKLLLLSDGSLTVELELLRNARVEIELVTNDFTTLEPDESDLLLEDQETESVEREVWLTADDTRLVYARTLIPIRSIDDTLRKELDRRKTDPLGRTLHTLRIPFEKEGLEVGVAHSEVVARGFGIDPRSPLAARRYLLTNTGYDSNRVIKALVTELFSPGVVPPPAARLHETST